MPRLRSGSTTDNIVCNAKTCKSSLPQFLNCSKCTLSYHRECVGIDESLYDSLMVNKCKGLMWHCDSCPVENDDVDITKNNDFEQIATEIKKKS